MRPVTEQKCPACGAPLRFDPASGKLICDYCGTVTDLPSSADTPAATAGTGKEQGSGSASGQNGTAGKADSGKPQGSEELPEEDTISGFDFQSMTDAVSVPDAEDLPVYNCVSCGAEVITPPEQAALTCPYCGNNIVLTDKISGKLRPDGVIPFKIRPEELPDAVNRFYSDKKLLPRGFFSRSTMGKVTGVYVPFWVFNGKAGGQMTYRAQTSAASRSGDYIITRTDHYQLIRDAALSFDNLPVDASGRIEDRLMDSLEPFDSSETKPFDMRYLAGFTADRFDQKKSDLSSRARSRMLKTMTSLVDSEAAGSYGAVTRQSARLHVSLDAKYILFPVYLFEISHDGKSYPFAVNGQTGKVVGDVPTDSGVSTLYFLKRFALVSGTLIILTVAKYMLGM